MTENKFHVSTALVLSLYYYDFFFFWRNYFCLQLSFFVLLSYDFELKWFLLSCPQNFNEFLFLKPDLNMKYMASFRKKNVIASFSVVDFKRVPMVSTVYACFCFFFDSGVRAWRISGSHGNNCNGVNTLILSLQRSYGFAQHNYKCRDVQKGPKGWSPQIKKSMVV